MKYGWEKRCIHIHGKGVEQKRVRMSLWERKDKEVYMYRDSENTQTELHIPEDHVYWGALVLLFWGVQWRREMTISLALSSCSVSPHTLSLFHTFSCTQFQSLFFLLPPSLLVLDSSSTSLWLSGGLIEMGSVLPGADSEQVGIH